MFLILLMLPVTFVIVGLLGVGITLGVNDYIIPLTGGGEENFIGLPTGMIIATCLIMFYFFLFTRNLESDKFKNYRYKNF